MAEFIPDPNAPSCHYGEHLANQAEQQRMAEDARRYRWLREQPLMDMASCWLVNGDVKTPTDLDVAIDAEIFAETKQKCAA